MDKKENITTKVEILLALIRTIIRRVIRRIIRTGASIRTDFDPDKFSDNRPDESSPLHYHQPTPPTTTPDHNNDIQNSSIVSSSNMPRTSFPERFLQELKEAVAALILLQLHCNIIKNHQNNNLRTYKFRMLQRRQPAFDSSI